MHACMGGMLLSEVISQSLLRVLYPDKNEEVSFEERKTE